MDSQTVINLVLGAGFSALGWFAKTVYGAVKGLETDLAAHKIEVARDYATNSDLARIDMKLDRILDKIDQKQDR